MDGFWLTNLNWCMGSMPQTKQPQTQTSSDLSGPFSTARPVTIGVIKIVMAAGQWTRHAAWQAVVRSWVADVRKNANPPHPSSASQPTPPPFAASTPKDTCKYILLSHYMAEFFSCNVLSRNSRTVCGDWFCQSYLGCFNTLRLLWKVW